MLHSEYLPTNGIHIPHSWTYSDVTARTGATGFVAGDIGKTCYQIDTGVTYTLIATTPTWQVETPKGLSGDISVTTAGVVSVNPSTVKRPISFTIQGALATTSYAWIVIPYAMTLGNIKFFVTTAVATSDMNIEVTYGTNPASMTTLYASSKPKIASGSTNSTGNEGTLTTTNLAQYGYIKVTLSGTFTAATDLTPILYPA